MPIDATADEKKQIISDFKKALADYNVKVPIHLDPPARAAFVGLTANHTKAHTVRAVLEGVAFSLRDSLEIFRELNLPIEKFVWAAVQNLLCSGKFKPTYMGRR